MRCLFVTLLVVLLVLVTLTSFSEASTGTTVCTNAHCNSNPAPGKHCSASCYWLKIGNAGGASTQGFLSKLFQQRKNNNKPSVPASANPPAAPPVSVPSNPAPAATNMSPNPLPGNNLCTACSDSRIGFILPGTDTLPTWSQPSCPSNYDIANLFNNAYNGQKEAIINACKRVCTCNDARVVDVFADATGDTTNVGAAAVALDFKEFLEAEAGAEDEDEVETLEEDLE